MKLQSPYKTNYSVSQPFGQNANTYYKEGGLLGHTGWDVHADHGSEIIAVADSICVKVLNKDDKDLMRYRAVLTLWEDAGVWYEVSYGHLGEIFVKNKQKLKVGDLIGTQSNTGNVSSKGKKVTLKEKQNGSGLGSHLHFQMKLVRPTTKGRYAVINPNNGYAGCVDPAPFFNHKDIYPVLRYGMRSEAVKALQQRLKIPMDGIFGLGTEKAVKAFQKKHKLTADGVVGQLTWGKLLA